MVRVPAGARCVVACDAVRCVERCRIAHPPTGAVGRRRGPSSEPRSPHRLSGPSCGTTPAKAATAMKVTGARGLDRKSTRLNSSHLVISYAVFCLKKKKQNNIVNHV